MNDRQNKIDRRNFLRGLSTAGVGSLLASAHLMAAEAQSGAAEKSEESKTPQVPKKVLGKTGVKVPILGLGTMFNLVDNQLMLRSTLRWGVSYWDTAHNYAGGNSELGIGEFFKKNPELRKDVFLVTKASRSRTVEEMEDRLQLSLKRMNTDHIDLYYAPHGVNDPGQLTDELRKWAESAKKRKLIRFFGFSTHQNMAGCLAAAAKLDWIDAIMPMCNFRVMQDKKMQDAVQACYEAKIGIVAMKTTGKTTIRQFRLGAETEADKKMVGHFIEKGFTPEQAGIKFVQQDKRIVSACVQMENVAVLTANVAASLDKTKLTAQDMQMLSEYARATCSGYCAGCADICDGALQGKSCVSDIMRYLMYYNSYGDHDRARQLFAEIPADVRNRLLRTDYSAAEARCPQRLAIGELITEAVGKLA